MKLSIIIPIYNVEPYLRKCVNSLIHQDFADYEVVLVDDGSTDGSGKICDEIYESINDERLAIRVIHQENRGLSAARNAGLKVAKGEYIMFVDSDDYIEPNVLAGLLTQVERDNLDVLRYRLQYVREVTGEGMNGLTDERKYEVYNPYKSDPFEGNDYSEEPIDGVSFLNSRMSTACYAWAFVIKRSLIVTSEGLTNERVNDCLFTEGIYFEDTDWTPRMLCRAKRVASTNTVVYNYLQREGSITKAIDRCKQKKALDDKIRLVGVLQRQADALCKSGHHNRWYKEMISDVVVSIVSMLSVDFYDEKAAYLAQLKGLQIYPIENRSIKARLINLSPRLAVELLHFKMQNNVLCIMYSV